MKRPMEEEGRALPTPQGLAGWFKGKMPGGQVVSGEDEVMLWLLLGCSSCPVSRCCGSARKERSCVCSQAAVWGAQGTEMALGGFSLCHSPSWVAASSSGHV